MSEITRPRIVVADPGIYGKAIRRGITNFKASDPDVDLTVLLASRDGLLPALGRFFTSDSKGNMPAEAAVVPGEYESMVSALLALARDPQIAGIELNEGESNPTNAYLSLFPDFLHVPQIGPANFFVVHNPTFPEATYDALVAAYNLFTRQEPITGGASPTGPVGTAG